MENNNLSRRQFIINSTGTGFTALLLACGIKQNNAESFVNTVASPIDAKTICSLTPQKEEGPFFIEGANVRKNIREDSGGKNLLLKMQIVDVNKCQPIQNAIVNIWHCDANGIYSGYENMNPNNSMDGGGFPPNGMPSRNGNGMPPPRDGRRPPPPPNGRNGMPPPPRDGQRMPPPNGAGGMHATPNSDKRFLRGVQITNEKGEVEFETVYPGWYAPRAVHIHTKIFLNDREMLTSQMFFPEDLNDKIFKTVEPYKARGANPNKTVRDPIAGEDPPMLKITETENLITATIIIGVKSA